MTVEGSCRAGVILITVAFCAAPADALADEQAQAPIEVLIQQLGDESFEKREQALERLIDLGQPAVPLLEKAAKSADAEVAFRARQALRSITSLELAEQEQLRAAGLVSFYTGDQATMLRCYRRLSQVANASINDHRWCGHAEQLLGNWKAAAGAYLRALDQIDLVLQGEVEPDEVPGELESPARREDLVKQRLGLIVIAARLQRELADDPKAAEETLLRLYQHDALLNESLDELAAKWRAHIAEALRADKTMDELRRDMPRQADLHFPMIALRELARTQEQLRKTSEALETWRRVHLLTGVYLGSTNSVDANAVGRLVQMSSRDAPLDPPGTFLVSEQDPSLALNLADPGQLAQAYSIHQDYWTFAVSPPPGKEFATVKFDCDIEQLERRYGGQFDCWTEIGRENPSRKGIGNIGWPFDQELGRGIQSARFEINPGTGPLHFKVGSWPEKFKTHAVTMTATLRDRVEDDAKRPKPVAGFRIQNECLPIGGQLSHNGEDYRTEVASHNVAPGKHTYAYSHPEREQSQSVTIDAEPGKYYGLFFNLDSPFESRLTNLSGFSSRYGPNSSFVRMSDGRWLVAWANDSLQFATSDDLVNWSDPCTTNEAALYGSHYNCLLPSLYAGKDGTVWLAYFSNRLDVDRMNTGGYRLFVMHSKDGKNWSAPRAIQFEMSGWPPGNVQILDGPDGKVWMFNRLQYAMADSVQDITKFEDLEIPATATQRSHARNPHAVVDAGGRVHVVWDHFAQTLCYSRRELSGKWTEPVELRERKPGSTVSHPQLFLSEDLLVLLYAGHSGAFIQRGRFVERTPVFGEATKITHHVSPLISTEPRRLDNGQLAILCGNDSVWLRTVEPEALYGPAMPPK